MPALKRKLTATGIKNVDDFLVDPAQAQPPAAQPDPQVQIKAAQMQAEMQLAREKAAAEIALARERMHAEIALERERMRMQSADEVRLEEPRPGGELDK